MASAGISSAYHHGSPRFRLQLLIELPLSTKNKYRYLMNMRNVLFFAIASCIVSPVPARTCKMVNCDMDDLGRFMASDGASLVRAIQRELPDVLRMPLDGRVPALPVMNGNPPPAQTALSVAFARAWKQGFIEKGAEKSRSALLACQRETSIVLTVPFMRSEGQQAHCFRF